MAKVLYLFSKTFPFGTGEQYIENELPFLAATFDKVLIYPADWFDANEVHTRKLPGNIEVINFNRQLKPVKKNIGDLLFVITILVKELMNAGNFFKELFRSKYLWNIAQHQWFTALNFADHLARHHRSDELYFYCYWTHNSAVMLSMLKRKKIIQKFVMRAHSIDLYHYNWALAKELKVPPFEYTKFKEASAIYPVSQHGEHFLKKKFPSLAGKIKTAYLGVSDAPGNSQKNKVFTIVTCSNLSANKRMIELARAVERSDFDITWIHFGDGYQRADIEEIIPKLSPGKKIILKGNTPNELVREFLSKEPIDLFVNLSIVEGLPVSLMEAASAGIPLLATAVYGSPEIARENVSGYTLPVNFTAEELVALLAKIQKDPEANRKLGGGARKHFLENFNATHNYTQFASNLLNYKNTIV